MLTALLFIATIHCTSVADANVAIYPLSTPMQFTPIDDGQSVFILGENPVSKSFGLFIYDFSAGQVTSPADVSKLKYADWFNGNSQGTFAVISAAESGEIESYYLWDVKNQTVNPLVEHTSNDPIMEFSPSGRYLYLLMNPDGGLNFNYIDLTTGQQKAVYAPANSESWNVSDFNFESGSDSISFIVSSNAEAHVVFFDPQAGVLLDESIKSPDDFSYYSLSQDLRNLFYSTDSSGGGILRNVVTGQEKTVPFDRGVFWGTDWLMIDNGKRIYAHNIKSNTQVELELTTGDLQDSSLDPIDSLRAAVCEIKSYGCDSLRVFSTVDFSSEAVFDLSHLPGVATVYEEIRQKAHEAVLVKLDSRALTMQKGHVWKINLDTGAETHVADISGVSLASYIGGFCQMSADEDFLMCLDTDSAADTGTLSRIDLR